MASGSCAVQRKGSLKLRLEKYSLIFSLNSFTVFLIHVKSLINIEFNKYGIFVHCVSLRYKFIFPKFIA